MACGGAAHSFPRRPASAGLEVGGGSGRRGMLNDE